MSSGRAARIVFLVAVALVLTQPGFAYAVPTHGASVFQSLCFCQSGASKPSQAGALAGLSGSSLVVVAGAGVVASIMGLLLVRLMKKDSERSE